MESILKCLERAGILLAVAEPVPEFFVTIGFGMGAKFGLECWGPGAGIEARSHGQDGRKN
jgi:hypothetical protein